MLYRARADRPGGDSLWDGPVSYTHLDVYKRQLLMREGALIADLAADQALASGALERCFGVSFATATVEGQRLVVPKRKL